MYRPNMSEYLIQCMPIEYKKTLSSRIQAHSHPEEATGCRLWGKSTASNGYPQLKVTVQSWGSKPQSVHRLVYYMAGNTSTPGHEISHLCHNKLCVEVSHLSSEPPAVNSQRNNCRGENICSGHGAYADCLLLPRYRWLQIFVHFVPSSKFES